MSRFTGITFNDKHSFDDFGITIDSRTIGFPEKNKITETVPFSNVTYDFSGVYGEQTYTERELTYKFNILGRNRTKEEFVIKRMQFVNFLTNTQSKVRLYDDVIPNWYFMAEMVKAPTYNYMIVGGTFEVTFTAYPFKIAHYPEGNDLWDPFCFATDIFQDVEFKVNGSLEVNLYNVGTKIVNPIIKCDAPMSILKDGVTYNLESGSTQSYDFWLGVGVNTMTITGDGTISFEFYREII